MNNQHGVANINMGHGENSGYQAMMRVGLQDLAAKPPVKNIKVGTINDSSMYGQTNIGAGPLAKGEKRNIQIG